MRRPRRGPIEIAMNVILSGAVVERARINRVTFAA